MNETGNPQDNSAETVPQKVLREFREWHRDKTLTPEQTNKASLVMQDLRILSKLPRPIQSMINLAAQNVAEFREMLNVR